jgi:predicted metalloprotease
MKQAEQTRGVPLAGLAVKVTPGFYLFRLSNAEAEKDRNIQLLKERSWFDIPVVYNNNRRAILALEKGTPGERVFADAFKVWRQEEAAHAAKGQADAEARRSGAPQDDMGRFVSRVLGSTELQWKQIFAQDGRIYRAPVLVLYRGVTHDCGGVAQNATGPFYCPMDQKVYLDTSFLDQIAARFRACDVDDKCQFARAYVIAHEIGHHVQNLLGILPKAQQAQRSAGSRAMANHIQVQVELQADCLAGVWANHQNEYLKSQDKPGLIEAGDLEATLRTAAAIGDDTLQRKAQDYVVPDPFTHGSAEQRQRWFNAGLKSGSVASCNTFAAAQL